MSDEENESGEAPGYPPEVEALHVALRRLGAVRDVQTSLRDLSAFDPSTYSLPGEFGDLPHALLRRTGGGLADEVWVYTEFELTRDEAGWLTLEFLAWWVRDLSRSGDQVQLRPMALPPKAYEVQLGTTLKFIVDHFFVCEEGDLTTALEAIEGSARSLALAIATYAETLGPLVEENGGDETPNG